MSETVTIAAPDAGALVSGAEAVLALAQGFHIDSPQMFELAADELRGVKGKMKELDDRRKTITKPLDEAKARVMDLFRRPLEILTQAEAVLKRAMLGYQQEQDRVRLAAEAEARRVAKLEEERLAKEREREARKLEKKGAVEEAEVLRAAPAPVVPIAVAAAPAPKAKGISTRTVWHHRVVNAQLLPREYLVANEKMLEDLARATKGAVAVPGVEFWSEEVMAAGRSA